MPNMGERLCPGYTKFDLTVDEGKGLLNPSRDEKIKASTAEGRWGTRANKNEEIPVLTFLLCDPG